MRGFPLVAVSARKGLGVDVAVRQLLKRLVAKEEGDPLAEVATGSSLHDQALTHRRSTHNGRRTSNSKRMAKSAGDAMRTRASQPEGLKKEVKRAATETVLSRRRRDVDSDDEERQPAPGRDEGKDVRTPSALVGRQSGEASKEGPQRKPKDEESLFNSDDIIIPNLSVPPKRRGIAGWLRKHLW